MSDGKKKTNLKLILGLILTLVIVVGVGVALTGPGLEGLARGEWGAGGDDGYMAGDDGIMGGEEEVDDYLDDLDDEYEEIIRMQASCGPSHEVMGFDDGTYVPNRGPRCEITSVVNAKIKKWLNGDEEGGIPPNNEPGKEGDAEDLRDCESDCLEKINEGPVQQGSHHLVRPDGSPGLTWELQSGCNNTCGKLPCYGDSGGTWTNPACKNALEDCESNPTHDENGDPLEPPEGGCGGPEFEFDDSE